MLHMEPGSTLKVYTTEMLSKVWQPCRTHPNMHDVGMAGLEQHVDLPERRNGKTLFLLLHLQLLQGHHLAWVRRKSRYEYEPTPELVPYPDIHAHMQRRQSRYEYEPTSELVTYPDIHAHMQRRQSRYEYETQTSTLTCKGNISPTTLPVLGSVDDTVRALLNPVQPLIVLHTSAAHESRYVEREGWRRGGVVNILLHRLLHHLAAILWSL